MNRVHPSDKEQAEVHQVALTPATVAFQLVQQVRRQFLIGARQIVGNPHPQPARRISAASTKSCDRIDPAKLPSPGSGAGAQCSMNGFTRIMALWPQ